MLYNYLNANNCVVYGVAAKNNADLETYKLVQVAMASEVAKEEFKRYLEMKKAELKRNEKQDS